MNKYKAEKPRLKKDFFGTYKISKVYDENQGLVADLIITELPKQTIEFVCYSHDPSVIKEVWNNVSHIINNLVQEQENE
ncbi:hypothetical protein ELUMI_v1c05340 [Williamsoniiplasma luminosum]|uniref:Uncharacterized protein n=1 Tax=Williamsoniiplasma luminosum TaxID=214888 RepID=A0A2K8NVP8_9MOLU|nr:hypothetical protein [Williamsoniiplasma luminosum]ATZ17258.1 hypothetical protein ELUMI_v1c05340 [Williamsoniiplasma luminosum]